MRQQRYRSTKRCREYHGRNMRAIRMFLGICEKMSLSVSHIILSLCFNQLYVEGLAKNQSNSQCPQYLSISDFNTAALWIVPISPVFCRFLTIFRVFQDGR